VTERKSRCDAARHSGVSRNPGSCSPARHSREGGNPVLASFKSRASTRLRRAAYFLCSCKESRQRNTPQRIAPFGHRAQRVRVSGRVPLIAHPVQQRNARDPSRAPCGPDRPLSPQCHGAPGTAERARPARRSQSRKASQAVALDVRAPSAAARAGRISPQGRAQGCARVREWAGSPSSETRPDLAHCRRQRGSRGAFLLVTFLCASKEK